MKPGNFFSKAAKSVLLVLCLVISASQAYAEVKIESVSQTVGVMGKNMEVTLTGSGFDENTKVSMYIDSGNRKAIIGSVDTLGNAQCVVVQDNKAYVTIYNNLYGILDRLYGWENLERVSDFSALFVDPFSTSYTIFEWKQLNVFFQYQPLTKERDTLISYNFFEDNNGGLRIIDISDPKNPKIIGSVGMPGNAENFVILDSKAYIASGYNGLQIIDINDPKNPKIIGSIDTPGYAYAISVTNSGDMAYIADGNSGLQIIDIKDPKKLQIVGSVDTPGTARSVFVNGDKAYVADENSGLQIIDIGDPKKPQIIGSVDTPGTARSVFVNGDKAYVADENSGVQIIDIGDPKKSQIIGSIDTPGTARSVFVNGDKAYVADGYSGLQIISINDPKNPQNMGFVDTPGIAQSVFVSGDNVYLGGGDNGLQIIDISSLKKLQNSLDTTSYTESVSIIGGKAYVAGGFGLQIVDISDPKNMQIIGSFNTPNSANNISVVGDKAYITGGFGLQIIDISDPKNPRLIGSVAIQGSANSISVIGDKVYIDNGYNGLQVIDISDPKNPVSIGYIVAQGFVNSISVIGDKAYTIGGFGLKIIDISDLKNPRLIGSAAIQGSANSISVIGDKAYIASGDSGLQVIDISTPEKPKSIASIDTPGFSNNISVVGDKAYVADKHGGLQVIDISTPEKPKLIGSINTPGIALSVSVVGDKAYVADGNSGLVILPIPVDINPISLKNSKQISVILPTPEIAGNYTLFAYNINSNEKVELLGAVEFVDREDTRANILKAKAIIVAGMGPYKDSKGSLVNDIWEETQDYAKLAYDALRYQGYTEDNILYLSSDYTEGVSRYASKRELKDAITTWATADNPSSIMIYFVGHGNEKEFFINGDYNETVTTDDLKIWLDKTLAYRVTFIYDACKSGTFIHSLKVGNQPQGKERIIIASASEFQAAYFNSENSFSNLFWSGIYGKTSRKVDLDNAFQFASRQMRNDQTPLIDANGNGLTNESADKEILRSEIGRNYYDIVNMPIITKISESKELQNKISTDIQAEVQYNGSDALTVWAEITPPNQSPPLPNDPIKTVNVIRQDLSKDETGVFRANYNFPLNGTYSIVFYAKNQNSNIPSAPRYAAITQMQGTNISQPDSYESDDSRSSTKPININNLRHNFHQPGDADWVIFYAEFGKLYYFKINSLNPFCNPKIELYDNAQDISSNLQLKDGIQTWSCLKSGQYYVRLTNSAPNIFGQAIAYDFWIYEPTGGFGGYITGKITPDAAITTDTGASAVADTKGLIDLLHPSGSSLVTVWVPGFKSVQSEVEITEGGKTTISPPVLSPCESLPTARIISLPSPITISNNEPVNFKGDAGGGAGGPYEYFWYFGGGVVNSDKTDKKDPGDVVFKKLGAIKAFSVVFYVKDAQGCVNKSQTVRVNYVQPDPINVDDSLALNIPCAEYQGTRYGFTLNYSAVSDDPAGLYWKMDTSTFRTVNDNERGCIPVGNDLKFSLPSVTYRGTTYAFSLNYNTPIISDPLEFYWKMDLSTAKAR